MKIRYYAEKMYSTDVGSPESPGSGSPSPSKNGSSGVLGIIIMLVLTGVVYYVAVHTSRENESKGKA